jgi:hypothetical protein
MTSQSQTKPQTTKGGALNIHEDDVVPIGTDAELEGNKQPLDQHANAGKKDKAQPDQQG